MLKFALMLALAGGWLAGCSSKKPVVDPLPVLNPAKVGGEAETDALEVNQIRKQYDDCIQKLGPKHPTCMDMEWTYQDAKARYDAAAGKKSP